MAAATGAAIMAPNTHDGCAEQERDQYDKHWQLQEFPVNPGAQRGAVDDIHGDSKYGNGRCLPDGEPQSHGKCRDHRNPQPQPGKDAQGRSNDFVQPWGRQLQYRHGQPDEEATQAAVDQLGQHPPADAVADAASKAPGARAPLWWQEPPDLVREAITLQQEEVREYQHQCELQDTAEQPHGKSDHIHRCVLRGNVAPDLGTVASLATSPASLLAPPATSPVRNG
jgi:hypothetical protein